MKYILISALLCVFLAACGSAIRRSPVNDQNEQMPGIIATEKIVALTKIPQMTGEAETQTEISPKNGETVTAIVATKFALGTEAAETITAMPSHTPMPEIPVDSPLCRSTDLLAYYEAGPLGAMMGMFSIGVIFRDVSNAPCYMQAWPQIVLVDRQGKPIDVDYNYFDPSGDANSAATKQAGDYLTAKLGLWPNQEASVSLLWGNWCGLSISDGVVIRIALLNNSGVINLPTYINMGGTCNAPSYRSEVSISKLVLLSTPIP